MPIGICLLILYLRNIVFIYLINIHGNAEFYSFFNIILNSEYYCYYLNNLSSNHNKIGKTRTIIGNSEIFTFVTILVT